MTAITTRAALASTLPLLGLALAFGAGAASIRSGAGAATATAAATTTATRVALSLTLTLAGALGALGGLGGGRIGRRSAEDALQPADEATGSGRVGFGRGLRGGFRGGRGAITVVRIGRDAGLCRLLVATTLTATTIIAAGTITAGLFAAGGGLEGGIQRGDFARRDGFALDFENRAILTSGSRPLGGGGIGVGGAGCFPTGRRTRRGGRQDV